MIFTEGWGVKSARNRVALCLLVGVLVNACGSSGSVSNQPLAIPLGLYLAANTSTGSTAPLVGFSPSATTTCLGLFDSRLTLSSATSLVEVRRYLNPPVFSNGVTLGTIVVDSAEVAAYSTDGFGTAIIQHARSADTARFAHEAGQDVLRVSELFNANANCTDTHRVMVTYIRQ